MESSQQNTTTGVLNGGSDTPVKKKFNPATDLSGGANMFIVCAAVALVYIVMFSWFCSRSSDIGLSALACSDNPSFVQTENSSKEIKVTKDTETFVFDSNQQVALKSIPAEPSFKPHEKGEPITNGCAVAKNYDGEKYVFSYINPETSETIEVTAPKQLVNLTPPSGSDEPTVQVETVTVNDGGEVYGDIVNRTSENIFTYKTYTINTPNTFKKN